MSAPDPRREVVAYPLARDFLVVAGPDAGSYLQGQLSQDVESMAPGDSAWSFALAPAGKVDAWFRISRREGDWVLDVDDGFGEALAGRLTRFLLRTDATIQPAMWRGIAVRGPGAVAAGAGGAGFTADPAWPGIEGVDLLGPEVETPPGLATGDAADLDALRIECGVPVMGLELGQSTIPAATGVVERSVSFTKGCFTGQELAARINSRGGAAPTRLCGVVGAADHSLLPEATLTVDGDDAGIVTSVSHSSWRNAPVALAYVKRAVEVPTEAEVDGEAGPEAVSLVRLPVE
jgi:folate-binding protein YgfZ